MSALLTPPRDAGVQQSLFAPPAPTKSHAASPAAPARRQGPSLDDLVAQVWEGLLAGAPSGCPACGRPMTASRSAGAGLVGGHCGGCGATLT